MRNPKDTISPFETSEIEGGLEFIYTHIQLLETLGEELSKPITPKKANLEYLASQFLSELIKDIGFHGIIYRSSLEEGNNYVIFADKRLKPDVICKYRIADMRYRSELISEEYNE